MIAAENTVRWQRLARMRDELVEAERDRYCYRAERDTFRGQRPAMPAVRGNHDQHAVE
jgi:hypothetical protein